MINPPPPEAPAPLLEPEPIVILPEPVFEEFPDEAQKERNAEAYRRTLRAWTFTRAESTKEEAEHAARVNWRKPESKWEDWESAFKTMAEEDDWSSADTSDPLAIVRRFIVSYGRRSVSLSEIREKYSGERELLGVGDLLDIEGLALEADKTFTLDSRFYSGEIINKKIRMESLASKEENPDIRRKWLSQAKNLLTVFPRRDSEGITYGLRQKWIPFEYLREFLEEYQFRSVLDSKGNPAIINTWDQFAANLTRYLRGDGLRGRQDIKWDHRRRIERMEADFDQWLHRHHGSVDLAERYNLYFNSYLEASYESDSLGIDEFLKGELVLHPYQREEVRRLLAEEKGICAYGVGLGKTLIALALYAMGTKRGHFKRTLVVVPASVLGAWDQECRRFFKDEFYKREIAVIGLATDGAGKGFYDWTLALDDLFLALDSKRSLVIMTKEKFASLGLRDENKLAFAEYIRKFCPNMNSAIKLFMEEKEMRRGRRTKDEIELGRDMKPAQKAPKTFEGRGGKIFEIAPSGYPYFEDFGFDNLIIDEAHVFKNCLTCSGSHTKIAYLSSPVVSSSGLNALSKAHYLRSVTGGKGSYGLTATPVTNSPLEIFNMLALVTDLSVFRSMGVNTINDVVRVFGKIEVKAVVKVSGEAQEMEALMGFVNLDGLRTLFNRFVHFEREDYVGGSFVCPEKTEIHETVKLTEEQEDLYKKLREEALAIETGTRERFIRNKVAYIFSIIRDMDRLTMDPDFLERMTTFVFSPKDRRKLPLLMESLPSRWKVGRVSDRTGQRVMDSMVMNYEVVRTMDGRPSIRVPEDMEAAMFAAIRAAGIDEENISHPLNPKYERLIQNMTGYLEESGKQLIFTEEKVQHRKLKRILVEKLDLLPEEVGIINAEESQGSKLEKTIRDYNIGRKKVIIANRKAELGVNLQVGTTAIHHLTLPWTPASIQQRNGRGIRQGNLSEEVRVHYYFGENTFDSYRHTILKAKSNWIGELLTGELPSMVNGEAPDLDEILDLLANSPEEAEARRVARKVAAVELYLKKQREGLFHILRNLTVMRARTRKEESKQDKSLSRIETAHKATLKEIETLDKVLLNKRQDTQTTLRRILHEIQEKSKALYSINTKVEDIPFLKAEIKALQEEKNAVEIKHIRSSSEIQEKIKALKNASNAARGLKTEAQISKAALREKDLKYIKQNLVYIEEMEREGKLPFPIELTKRLDDILVTEDNRIITKGDLLISLTFPRYMEIITVFPISKLAWVKYYEIGNPNSASKEQSVNEKELSDYRPVSREELKSLSRVPYGKLHASDVHSPRSFPKVARELDYDLSRGLVGRKDGELYIHWGIAEETCDQEEEPREGKNGKKGKIGKNGKNGKSLRKGEENAANWDNGAKGAKGGAGGNGVKGRNGGKGANGGNGGNGDKVGKGENGEGLFPQFSSLQEILDYGVVPVFPEPADPAFSFEVFQAYIKAKEAAPDGTVFPTSLMRDLFGDNFEDFIVPVGIPVPPSEDSSESKRG